MGGLAAAKEGLRLGGEGGFLVVDKGREVVGSWAGAGEDILVRKRGVGGWVFWEGR